MTHDTHPTPPTHTDTPHPHIWGDVKKTSPREGEVFFTGDIHTYIHARGHRNSMTELAQWADSVKIAENNNLEEYMIVRLEHVKPALNVMHIYGRIESRTKSESVLEGWT